VIDPYWDVVFRNLNLVYLEIPRINHPTHDKFDRYKSRYYNVHKRTFENSVKRYSRPLRLALVAKTELRKISDEIGYGLFSIEKLPKGAWIGEYTGVIRKVIPAKESNKHNGRFLSDYAFTYPRPLPDGTRLEVDAMCEGNPLRFANHSFRPNASVDHLLFENRWVTFFRARKTIEPGQEILINYGMEYWTGGFRNLIL